MGRFELFGVGQKEVSWVCGVLWKTGIKQLLAACVKAVPWPVVVVGYMMHLEIDLA